METKEIKEGTVNLSKKDAETIIKLLHRAEQYDRDRSKLSNPFLPSAPPKLINLASQLKSEDWGRNWPKVGGPLLSLPQLLPHPPPPFMWSFYQIIHARGREVRTLQARVRQS